MQPQTMPTTAKTPLGSPQLPGRTRIRKHNSYPCLCRHPNPHRHSHGALDRARLQKTTSGNAQPVIISRTLHPLTPRGNRGRERGAEQHRGMHWTSNGKNRNNLYNTYTLSGSGPGSHSSSWDSNGHGSNSLSHQSKESSDNSDTDDLHCYYENHYDVSEEDNSYSAGDHHAHSGSSSFGSDSLGSHSDSASPTKICNGMTKPSGEQLPQPLPPPEPPPPEPLWPRSGTLTANYARQRATSRRVNPSAPSLETTIFNRESPALPPLLELPPRKLRRPGMGILRRETRCTAAQTAAPTHTHHHHKK